MKVLPFLSMLAVSSMLIFSSCGSGDEKKTTDNAATDTTKATTTEPAPVNTIVTTPQAMIVVRHKVKDFAQWKISYDAHDSLRLAFGIHSYVIGRGEMDSNMVFVATKADDIAKAKAFGKDPSLKLAMQKGGVIGAPTVQFETIVFQDTVAIDSKLRVLNELTVKDWDAWQKAFSGGNQERTDNGIVVRAYGHGESDNHKVSLVTALTDTAKAHAYWKSDMLKKRREASGVIGEPKRFVFRIVQRY